MCVHAYSERYELESTCVCYVLPLLIVAFYLPYGNTEKACVSNCMCAS